MKARQLIANAIYDPEELKKIGRAFDEAWARSRRRSATILRPSKPRV